MKSVIYLLSGIIACLCFSVCDVKNSDDAGSNIGINSSSSGCKDITSTKDTSSQDEDCSERLLWTYNSDTRQLDLVDQNAYEQCCFEYSGTVVPDSNGVYHFIQTDLSESPCDCICYFDFAITIPGLDAVTISLQIDRKISENADPYLIWEGQLDLTLGSGSVLIKQVDSCQ